MLVQTLSSEQAAPALTDSFSRGHDPSAHACKARPLTFVGWTSLGVSIVNANFLGYGIGERPRLPFFSLSFCLSLYRSLFLDIVSMSMSMSTE